MTQAVTFRLADSLPVHLRPPASMPVAELAPAVERLLDRGHGSCVLRERWAGGVVERALQHFDGERYRLLAWVVMPNHVHVLLETTPGHPLGSIVSIWKTFTAKTIQNKLGSRGRFWHPDFHDRYIRDAEHFERAVHYIENNPVKAGLVKCPEDWPFGSTRFHPIELLAPQTFGPRNAGETPAVPVSEV